MSVAEILGAASAVFGAVALVVAAAGLHRLPDALSRQHAGTKAVAFALLFLAAGAAALNGGAGFAVRCALLVALLFVTTPTASHLLARAAVRESGGDVGGASVPDSDARGPDAP
jgi:multicomponent Na+:H+ antiporter subunit G